MDFNIYDNYISGHLVHIQKFGNMRRDGERSQNRILDAKLYLIETGNRAEYIEIGRVLVLKRFGLKPAISEMHIT